LPLVFESASGCHQIHFYRCGTIDKLKPLTQHGYGMEKEAIRILKKTPQWKPAIKDGKTKEAYRKQTITFVVQ
jgi:protein TonB